MNQPAGLMGITSVQQTPEPKAQIQAEFICSFYLHATFVKEPNLELSRKTPENKDQNN